MTAFHVAPKSAMPCPHRSEVIINGKLDPPDQYSQYSGYAHLGAGLTVGMSSLAAGARLAEGRATGESFWALDAPAGRFAARGLQEITLIRDTCSRTQDTA